MRVPALLVLRDGSTVVIRPLASGDEAAITAWFKGHGQAGDAVCALPRWRQQA